MRDGGRLEALAHRHRRDGAAHRHRRALFPDPAGADVPRVPKDDAEVLSRARSDPRYLGYAQAALGTWWDSPSPPEVRVLRATIPVEPRLSRRRRTSRDERSRRPMWRKVRRAPTTRTRPSSSRSSERARGRSHGPGFSSPSVTRTGGDSTPIESPLLFCFVHTTKWNAPCSHGRLQPGAQSRGAPHRERVLPWWPRSLRVGSTARARARRSGRR